MKEFAVLEKIGMFKPTVVEDFDDVKDAAAYANIMRRRYTNREYSVFQLNEELLAPYSFWHIDILHGANAHNRNARA